jgi:hypothetical protein
VPFTSGYGRWCSLCEIDGGAPVAQGLKSLPDRPIQQAISSQA